MDSDYRPHNPQIQELLIVPSYWIRVPAKITPSCFARRQTSIGLSEKSQSTWYLKRKMGVH